MLPNLRLDEQHLYWLGDRAFVSVHEILGVLGLLPDFSNLPESYRHRGKEVHRACEEIDAGTFDIASIAEDYWGYIDAYRKFVNATNYRPFKWEIKLCDVDVGYAGTLDKVGYLHGTLGILDIKTSAVLDAATELQLSAYASLWKRNFRRVPAKWKYALQLKPDGTFNLVTKYTKTPERKWKSYLEVYQWKVRHRPSFRPWTSK